MRALEQALSDQPGTSIVPYVPILAGGKGGKGRNTDHKAAALACISELSGDGFATFQSVEVQPPRSYTHEELIPLIRDLTLSQFRAACEREAAEEGPWRGWHGPHAALPFDPARRVREVCGGTEPGTRHGGALRF